MIRKDISLQDCNIKLSSSPGVFSGYASVFNGNDSYNDTIKPGAFSKTLEERTRPPLMLFGHNSERVIGKWISLKEDDIGLKIKGEFTPGHTDAMNTYASLKHGAIDGLSIGFRIPKNGADEKEDGGRIIKEIDLGEISIVTFPADMDARVSVVKEDIDRIKSLKDAEQFLREADKFNRNTAKDFVSVLMREAKKIVIRNLGDDEKQEREQYEIMKMIERIKNS